jgi:NAD(P)-dependent dehydrogenase (short-subunit alcohol dehydrogenase family)
MRASFLTGETAVVGLVKADSSTYASKRIRINAVCPGYILPQPLILILHILTNHSLNRIIDTPMLSPELADFSRKFTEMFTPAKRLGLAEEVADVVVFLCSSLHPTPENAPMPTQIHSYDGFILQIQLCLQARAKRLLSVELASL